MDYLAAYEIMSEPRDKSLTGQQVREMYRGGCEAVQSIDPRTPCMVGSRNYYKLWTFNDDMYMEGLENIIYTFDYFVPDDWAFGKTSVANYGGSYSCKTLYPGWVSIACPNGGDEQ